MKLSQLICIRRANSRVGGNFANEGRGSALPEIRVRQGGKVSKKRVLRRFPSDMDAKVNERNVAATAAIKIAWLLVWLPGLIRSIIPRVIWAIPCSS